MKKLLSIILSLSVLYSCVAGYGLASYAYGNDDIEKNNTISDWAKAEVLEMYSLVKSRNEKLPIFEKAFNKPATREDFAGIAAVTYENLSDLYKMDLPAEQPNPFVDAKNNKFIERAYSYGIIKGVSADTFKPNATLTREQLCTMLYRIIEKINPKSLEVINGKDFVKDYKDIDKISDWAVKAVRHMNANGILKGDGIRLDPQGNVTREQSLALCLRLYKQMKGNDDLDYDVSLRKLADSVIHDELNYDKGKDPVIFDTYQDFDSDGIKEGILICKDAFGGVGDNIVYVDFDEKLTKCTKKFVMQCSDVMAEKAEIVKIKDKQNYHLYVKSVNTGFVLYEINPNDIKSIVEQYSFASGAGFAEILDSDNDGVYDCYATEQKSYDSFYFPIRLVLNFEKNPYKAFKEGEIDTKEYPTTPDEVVKQYLFLTYLKSDLKVLATGKYLKIKGLDERINELAEFGFKRTYRYAYKVLTNTAIGLENSLTFDSKVTGDKAVVKVGFNGDMDKFYKEIEQTKDSLYKFDLEKVNGKWKIIKSEKI